MTCVNNEGIEFEGYEQQSGLIVGIIPFEPGVHHDKHIQTQECCENDAHGYWHIEPGFDGVLYGSCVPIGHYCYSTEQVYYASDDIDVVFNYRLHNIRCLDGVLVGNNFYGETEVYPVNQECCGYYGGTWDSESNICVCEKNPCISTYHSLTGEHFEYPLTNVRCEEGFIVGDNVDFANPIPINEACCEGRGDWTDQGTNGKDFSCVCDGSGEVPGLTLCDTLSGYSITLSSVDNNGSLFSVDGDEDCCLNIQFDYLLKFDCNTLFDCLTISGDCGTLDVLEDMIISSTIQVNDGEGNWYPLSGASQEILNTTSNLAGFLDGNTNTGLLITGDANCDAVNACIINGLCGDCGVVSASTFNSDWVHVDYTICNEDVLADILGKEIKIGFDFNKCGCNYSFLLDNIELNKNCTTTFKTDKIVNSCPGFELRREVDNKKSWVNLNGFDRRDYELIQRDTHYDTNHERLIINTKEVDIALDAANTIECAVFDHFKISGCSADYIIDNGDREFCEINSSITTTMTGLTSGGTVTGGTMTCHTDPIVCVSGFTTPVYQTINDILSSNLSEITDVQSFIEVMLQELVDVKDRKVLQSYPTLRWLYEAYLGLITDCKMGPNQYTYCDINEFIGLVNGYWYELFEQVVPATTIWGATTVYRNSVFDQQKFQYKRYSLFTCGDVGPCDVMGCSNTNNDISNVPFPVIDEVKPVPGIGVIFPDLPPAWAVTDDDLLRNKNGVVDTETTRSGKVSDLIFVDTEYPIYPQIAISPISESKLVETIAYNNKLEKSIKVGLKLPSGVYDTNTKIGIDENSLVLLKGRLLVGRNKDLEKAHLTLEKGDITRSVVGCTDPNAINYNPEATVNSNCIYSPRPIGDLAQATDSIINQDSTINGGLEYFDVVGCTDPGATNYNPAANLDDGSCEYPLSGETCPHPCTPNEPIVIHCDGLSIYNMDDGSSFVGGISISSVSDGHGFIGEAIDWDDTPHKDRLSGPVSIGTPIGGGGNHK